MNEWMIEWFDFDIKSKIDGRVNERMNQKIKQLMMNGWINVLKNVDFEEGINRYMDELMNDWINWVMTKWMKTEVNELKNDKYSRCMHKWIH